MAKIAVLLAPGFEEAEAIITIDILRRMHIDVEMLACAESRAVVSYHDIPMVADSTLRERMDTLVSVANQLLSLELSATPLHYRRALVMSIHLGTEPELDW